MLHLMKVKLGRTVWIQALYFLYVCICPMNRILRIPPGMRTIQNSYKLYKFLFAVYSDQNTFSILKEGICIYVKIISIYTVRN